MKIPDANANAANRARFIDHGTSVNQGKGSGVGTSFGNSPKAEFGNLEKRSFPLNKPDPFNKSGLLNKSELNKTELNKSGLNSAAQNLENREAAELSGQRTISAGSFFAQTALSLAFPNDPLSIAILAFSRFFSLPLNQTLLGTLRKEILTSGKLSSPSDAKEKAMLEAETLAAVIARDKGVILSPEALERFAYLLEPLAYEGNQGAKGRGTGNRGEENRGVTKPDKAKTDKADSEEADWEEIPAAEEIKVAAVKQTKENRLLDFLNSIPGKNGQYWMIFPFRINVRGIELKVTLRLLRKELFSPDELEHFMVDIVGPKRQWRFFIGKAADKFNVAVRVFPGAGNRSDELCDDKSGELSNEMFDEGCVEMPDEKFFEFLKKEAEAALGNGAGASGFSGKFGGFDEILLLKGEEAPSWVDDLCAECLPSIDEEI